MDPGRPPRRADKAIDTIWFSTASLISETYAYAIVSLGNESCSIVIKSHFKTAIFNNISVIQKRIKWSSLFPLCCLDEIISISLLYFKMRKAKNHRYYFVFQGIKKNVPKTILLTLKTTHVSVYFPLSIKSFSNSLRLHYSLPFKTQ